MSNYEKPIVLADSELSEGVFTASGGYVTSSGDATAQLTSYDHYGNYYFSTTGFENGSTYSVVLTVDETDTISGLNYATWGDFGGVVNGNTVTFSNVCFDNQTNWQVRLWFDSQGNWENGWSLSDSDIPNLSVTITKVS